MPSVTNYEATRNALLKKNAEDNVAIHDQIAALKLQAVEILLTGQSVTALRTEFLALKSLLK